ncbi:hypothetical protein PMAYCL1PPCAC_33349 [Pristionchus mayeri]|uniref:Uncharacterized protein n=1 Tax=Pristionchus mayeri TaxID=1317129 RepID=A0AAN5DH49_9BILA|nr:hypothetical protein PMAYCL1PPCAC_06034 [Pristionchus mayeri]GMR63154.1 hypothetical protein PMAYCL1PPCAC_33349 [Pristionchus mayeri]
MFHSCFVVLIALHHPYSILRMIYLLLLLLSFLPLIRSVDVSTSVFCKNECKEYIETPDSLIPYCDDAFMRASTSCGTVISCDLSEANKERITRAQANSSCCVHTVIVSIPLLQKCDSLPKSIHRLTFHCHATRDLNNLSANLSAGKYSLTLHSGKSNNSFKHILQHEVERSKFKVQRSIFDFRSSTATATSDQSTLQTSTRTHPRPPSAPQHSGCNGRSPVCW